MNRQEREADLKETLINSDLDLSLKEALTYLYHWYMYERATYKRSRAMRSIRHHGSKLNEDKVSFQVRKYLKEF